jgi:hypothetical protein
LSQYNDGLNESNRNNFIYFAESNIPCFNTAFSNSIDYYYDDRHIIIDNTAKVLYYAFRCGILHEARISLFGGIAKLSENEIYKYYPTGRAYYDDGSDCPFVHIDPYNLICQVHKLLINYCDRLKRNDQSDDDLRTKFKNSF